MSEITNFYKPSDSPFLGQVCQVIRLKHMSRSTEKSCLYYILDYIYFHNKRHPQEMGVDEIRGYLSHLAMHKNVMVYAHVLNRGGKGVISPLER